MGSPGDLAEERQTFRRVVEEINVVKANALGFHLHPVGWEDTLPGHGRPQERINADLVDCDLAVLLLWKRWGSPTGTHSSGFHEEFQLCVEKNKPLLLYLKDIEPAVLQAPDEQLTQVLRFRREVEASKQLLAGRFDDCRRLETLLRRHLAEHLDKLGEAVPPPSSTGQAVLQALSHPGPDAMTVEWALAEEGLDRLERGHLDRATFLIELALRHSRQLDVLHAAQQLYFRLRRDNEYQAIRKEVAATAATTQNPRAQVFDHEAKGNLAQREGRYQDALQEFRICQDLAVTHGWWDTAAGAENHVATLLNGLGQRRQALPHAAKAFEYAARGQAWALASAAKNYEANIHLELGDKPNAIRAAKEAFNVASKNDIPREGVLAMSFLALDHDDPEDVLAALRRALRAAEPLDDPGLEVVILNRIGVIHIERQQLHEALETFRQGLATARRSRDSLNLAQGAYNVGAVAAALGDKKTACPHLKEAVAGFAAIGDAARVELCRTVMAQAAC